MSYMEEILDVSPQVLADDYDNVIEAYTIRKAKPPDAKRPPLTRYQECIPLLIEDIGQIQFEMGLKVRKTVFGVGFWNIMIYGHSVPLKIRRDKNIRSYLVDDGTGNIVVHQVYTSEKMKLSRKISELEAQVNYIKKIGYPQLGPEHKDPQGDGCKEIVACMETVLRKVKKQSYMPSEYLPLGNKVSVIGKPYRTKWGEIQIWAVELIKDSDDDRSKEIYFKNCLIQMYTDVYLKDNKIS